MQQIASQCTNCGAFTRRSLHHEEEYQSSVVLERLRTSNLPATDEEISHIRHTILSTVSDEISSIDSKVASLHEAIRSMEEERERLKTVQKKYTNLVSLHRTLPSEIWSEIFLHTLSSASDSNAFNVSGSIWQFSHVCQRWRNVALSLRSFWSTMTLRLPEAAQHEGDVQRLEAVIQRSHQGPLDVSLTTRYNSQTPIPNPSILKRILDIVLAESHRWRKLYLSDFPRSLNTLYVPLHNRLSRLESLSLYDVPEEELAVSVFEHCPRLTKLSLGGGTLGIEFPWDQITELDLSRMDLDGDEEERKSCMRLIGQCPYLETLSMPEWGSRDDQSAYTPITCSNMHQLDTMSMPVVNTLTLPHLREASLHLDPVTLHYDALYSFERLLIRSNCLGALTRLSLSSLPLAASPEHSLHSILSQTHSLAFLDLSVAIADYDAETDVSDREQIVAIVKSLAPTESVTFLPLLSSLRIRVYNHCDSQRLLYFGPVGSFASTVETRWKGDQTRGLARLKTCHFSVHARHLMPNRIYRDGWRPVAGIFNEAERFIFKALVDDGMDLAIRVTSSLTESFPGNSVVFAVSR
ncbi:hypothetical protein BDZ89DRAFT_834874 [Hymenopellis radicata]|nr:hypothetical protein BDZ89DRAFT_834874 [Hymenopellis radicata]